jgi:putative transposase
MVVLGIDMLVNPQIKTYHLHSSSFEKSIIERTIQYIKDRIENFDDYFPYRKKRCKLNHVTSWFNVFVDYHTKKVIA